MQVERMIKLAQEHKDLYDDTDFINVYYVCGDLEIVVSPRFFFDNVKAYTKEEGEYTHYTGFIDGYKFVCSVKKEEI